MSEIRKPRILIFAGYYLPGYKGGGPIRTIFNLTEGLKDYFDFWIVTRDRDLGDEQPYCTIEREVWNDLNGCKIYYIDTKNIKLFNIKSIIKSTPHDILYLNSFFDIMSLLAVLSYKFMKASLAPLLLAPRGEFSGGALSIKKNKKYIYINFSRRLFMYKDIYFHASTEYEKIDVLSALKVNPDKIKIAINVPADTKNEKFYTYDDNFNKKELKVVFLSRISRKKNLDFTIQILRKVSAKIVFDIYGPVEDLEYWEECKSLIIDLPKNIICEYKGPVHPNEINNIFSKYDIFFFPTKGENYGHVIAEAINAGTSVLLSDQTPWKNLEKEGVGCEFPLSKTDHFINFLENFSDMEIRERLNLRAFVKKWGRENISNETAAMENKRMFESLINIV